MKYTRLLPLIPLALVAACGGSGSDDDGNTPPIGAAIDITNGNGLLVAQVTYQTASTSGELAGLAGNTGLTGNGGGGLQKPSTQVPGIIDSMMQVPFGPIVETCPNGGTYTVSGDLTDPLSGTLSGGDTITAVYDNCGDGVSEVLDGTLELEIISLTGDVLSGLYEMTAEMRLTDFQSTSGADVITGNGDGTTTINTLQAPYVEASISGNSMTTDTNASSETLSFYSSAQTLDARVSPSPYTLTSSGTIDSTRLSGSVTYSTPVTFEGTDTNYPNLGEMLVVGEGSSARIIAQANGIDVVIEIYSNETGTGTPDSTINTTWTELAGL